MNRYTLAAGLRGKATKLERLAWKLEAFANVTAAGTDLAALVKQQRSIAKSLRNAADQIKPQGKKRS